MTKWLSLVAVFCAVFANGTKLRSSSDKPAAKVKKLIVDIEESISKAGEDSEMVFATLYTYDGQLDTSLKQEKSTLEATLIKLWKMQKTYSDDHNASHAKYTDLGTSAQNSAEMADKYEKGTTQARSRFQGLQDKVQMLVTLLRNAGVTPHGRLVTPEFPDKNGEPARVYSAIRRLLGGHPKLREEHKAAFDAFLSKHPADGGKYPVVDMTKDILQDTIAALSAVSDRLGSMKADALLQFESLHRRFEREAVHAGSSAYAQLGLEAENEQKAAELGFSIRFTSAVLKIDQKFYDAVKAHVKSNADIIYDVRDLRQSQLKTCRDLAGILSAEGAIAHSGISFLETSAEKTRGAFAGIQTKVENLVNKHKDTHAVLMLLKDMLDNNAPIDATGIRDTMVEMQAALRTIEGDQPQFEEAKRGCESQKFHANEEAESLKANLALMTAARDHAQKAIKAADTNVAGIEKKVQALDKSSTDFVRIGKQAIKTLMGQSRDRQAIMMAVKKATEVVGPTLPAGTSTVQLMQSLLRDIVAQEDKLNSYMTNQERFQAEFVRYVDDYKQLLNERRRHYESSLGVLQLHVSELASDLLAQQQTLATGKDITRQSQGLCESVLKFYNKHSKTRSDLSGALRNILSNMPTVLSEGVIAGQGDA